MTKDTTNAITPHSPITTASSFEKVGSIQLVVSSSPCLSKSNVKRDECYGTPTNTYTTLEDEIVLRDFNVISTKTELLIPDAENENVIITTPRNEKESLGKQNGILKRITTKTTDSGAVEVEDGTELEEAMAELSLAINNNSNLTKTELEYFHSMTNNSTPSVLFYNYDTNTTDEASIAGTCETMTSLASIRKATLYIKEDEKEYPSNIKKKLTAPPSSKRDSSVQRNLWQAHANRMAPKVVTRRMQSTNDLQALVSDTSNNINSTKLPSPTLSADAAIVLKPYQHPRASIRDFTANDILTPKKSNIRRDENGTKLAAQGGALSLGLAMPNFDDDDNNEDNDDDEDDDYIFNRNDSHASLVSLLTDDGGSLLGDYDDVENDMGEEPQEEEDEVETTMLFSSDRVQPSSFSSLFTHGLEDDVDDNASLTSKSSKKLQPILRKGHYNSSSEHISTDDQSTIESSKLLRPRPAGNRRFSAPSIRDIENGIEVIPNATSLIGYAYSYDDTESIVSYTSRNNISTAFFRSFNCADNKSITSFTSINDHSIPSLHRCNANDDESIRSLCSSIRRALSCPEADQIFNIKSLGDDLTLEDGLLSTGFNNNDGQEEDEEDNKSVRFAKTATLLQQRQTLNHCLAPIRISMNSSSQFSSPNTSLLVPSFGQYPHPTTTTTGGEEENVQISSSWSIQTKDTADMMQYNAWDVYNDEYCNNVELPFEIFGTSADDASAMPHVLSPPLMDSLRNFLPDRLFHQNYWLKYSLVRDGADLQILQRSIRASRNTLLAIETTTGHVFGCFTSTPWRKSSKYFGNGESFVWKMKQSRAGSVQANSKCYSIADQVKLESEIEVFGYSGQNDMIQSCRHDFIAVGGGSLKEKKEDDNVQMSFAIALDDELLKGTTSPCATFYSPCLIDPKNKSGDVFEVVNMEAWGFSPCSSEEDAQKNELRLMFAEGCSDDVYTDLDVIGTVISA